MSHLDPRNDDHRERRTARRNFLYGLTLLVAGAAISPFGVKLFEADEPEPIVPGAPLEGYPETVTESGYTSRASIEVVNQTVNPIESHLPLNPSNALVVRPGDRLRFRYECEMTSGVAFSFVTMTLPAGLKIVGDPWLRPPGKGSEKGEKLDDLYWGWVFDDSAKVNRVSGGLVATVETKYRTYITLYWGGAAYPPTGKPLSGLTRAVLRVEPL